jgi:outer membrane protein insertion porin family
MTGNDEGSLVIGARLPNVMGRAEKIQAEYSYGSKSTTNIGVSFSKPVHSRADTM